VALENWIRSTTGSTNGIAVLAAALPSHVVTDTVFLLFAMICFASVVEVALLDQNSG